MSSVYKPRTTATKLPVVKDKTLGALLTENGLDGKLDLVAQYNWGTKDKAEINRALFELVGCKTIDENDPLNSVLDPDRGTGGAILKPELWSASEVAFDKVHTVKVQKRLPATAVAITKLPALFNPEKETCAISYRLEGHTSRATIKDFEVHATGYYLEEKDEEGAGTRTVEKPSGTHTKDNPKETHIVRNTEPDTPRKVDYTWDGKSQAGIGILSASAKIISVCAPYFVSVRFYKDPVDKTAFIRMDPFYPRWNLTGKAKWDLDEDSLVVKWKVEGEDSSKAKLKNGQILVYEGETVVFAAPLTADQITAGKFDLLKETIHWDKTKVEIKKLPYRIQIQAHSDSDADNGLALAVMPTQVPPYNYEQVQFIGFNIRNDTNSTGTEYLGDDTDSVDIEFRCKAMVEAIQLAKTHVSADRKVLKLFVAPEFYFRGKKGAYAVENISTIVPRLRQETDKYDYLDWLFVFGTALGSYGHGSTGNPTVHGNALHLLTIDSINSATEITATVWSDPQKNWQLVAGGYKKTITAPLSDKGVKDPDHGGYTVKLKLDNVTGLTRTTDKTLTHVVEPVMKILAGGLSANKIRVASSICGRIAVEPGTNKVITIGGAYWQAQCGGVKRNITYVQRQLGYYELTLNARGPFPTGQPVQLIEPVAVEVINTALMQKGWHAPHLGDGSLRHVVTYKEDFSHIDYIINNSSGFYESSGINRKIRINYANDVSLLPTEGGKDIGGASPNVTRLPGSAVGSEINKSGLGGGCVIMIDRVSIGMEVCRDHCVYRLFNFYTGTNLRAGDPQVQVHLIPSWGMAIGMVEEMGTEVSALPNGLVFNVDGSRMESVARVYDSTYSCDDHVFVSDTDPGKCAEVATELVSGELRYKCATCNLVYIGGTCGTHGASTCDSDLRQMGTALHSKAKVDVPLSDDANFFTKKGNIEVFDPQDIPPADVATAPPSIAITNGTQKPGFNAQIKLTGLHLANTRFVDIEGDGVTLQSYAVISDTEVDAEVYVSRRAAIGDRNISVRTFNGPSNTVVLKVVTPPNPLLFSITPGDGEVHNVFNVVLRGADLRPVYDIQTSLPEVVILEMKNIADDQINLKIDVANDTPVGTCTFTVTSAGGSDDIDFTVNARPLPDIISVIPASYRQGTVVSGIVITGTDLTAQSLTVSGADVTFSSIVVDSDTQITIELTIDITAATGPRDLVVNTLSGDSLPYTIDIDPAEAPELLNINPTSLDQGLRVVATITGNYLLSPSGVTLDSDGIIHDVQVISDNEIKVDIEFDETATVGDHVIEVTTAGGSDTITFEATPRSAPVIYGVAPDTAAQDSTVQITVDGFDIWNFKQLNVSGAGITVQSIDDATQNGKVIVTLTIDATAPVGDRDLTVTNHAGESNAIRFTVT
jgi:hypothetical protein